MTMVERALKIEHVGPLLQDEPLGKHSSWRTGGRAEYFFEPADTADLINVVRQFGDKKITWLGLGSGHHEPANSAVPNQHIAAKA